MSDWTTARVVRDRDGDLWFRGCDSDSMWTANTDYPDVFLTSDEVVEAFGPLTPVLDADGLPVVRTVGDQLAERNGAELLAKQSQSAARDDARAERDALAAKVAALADWHETKAEKARRFRIEIDGRNPVMDKAAEVHTDAARRLRAALDEEPQP